MGMLVMGQAHRGAAHVHDDAAVFRAIRRADRPTLILPILVTVYPVQRIWIAIQKKTFVRIGAEKTQSDFLFHPIRKLLTVVNLDDGAIEIWILATIPEVRMIQNDALNDRHRRLSGDENALLGRMHGLSLLIEKQES